MGSLFFQCLERAYKRTVSLLWPFNKKTWIKLFFIFALTGGCSSFPPMNFNVPLPTENQAEKALDQEQEESKTDAEQIMAGVSQLKEAYQKNQNIFLGVFGAVFFMLGGFFILFMWLTSRIQFVALESLETNVVHIRGAWKKTSKEGNSFAIFRIFMILLFCLGLLAGGLLPGLFYSEGETTKWLVTSLLITLPLAFVWGFSYFMLDSFISVVMYFKKEASKPAFWRIVAYAKKNFLRGLAAGLLYVMVFFALSMGVGILVLLVGLIVFVPLGIAGALLIGFLTEVSLLFKVGLGFLGLMILLALGLTLVFLTTVPVGTLGAYLRLELVKAEMGEPNHG